MNFHFEIYFPHFKQFQLLLFLCDVEFNLFISSHFFCSQCKGAEDGKRRKIIISK